MHNICILAKNSVALSYQFSKFRSASASRSCAFSAFGFARENRCFPKSILFRSRPSDQKYCPTRIFVDELDVVNNHRERCVPMIFAPSVPRASPHTPSSGFSSFTCFRSLDDNQ